jgi:hypothetical protein
MNINTVFLLKIRLNVSDTPEQAAATVAKDAAVASTFLQKVAAEFMAWLPVGNRKWFVAIAVAFVAGWLVR